MEHNPQLTSSEVANLWSTYMADSMNICVMSYYLSCVEDKEIASIIQHSKHLSEQHLETISDIFETENIPIPGGFSSNDGYDNTPQLYSDLFYLYFLEYMGRTGPSKYGISLGTSFRDDIKSFYLAALQESGDLYDKVSNLMAKKGILVRTPNIPYPKAVEYIQDKNFMAGYLTLHKRPLLSIEITHLATNIKANTVGKTLLTGFAQVTNNEEVQKYCGKGIKLANDIVSSLGEFLEDGNINVPQNWDLTVTDNTKSPFSDKLMMCIISSLNSTSIGDLGLSIGASMRSDLVMEYTNLMSQVAKYATSGAKISTDNGWIEKPPHAIDHEKLQH